MLSKVKGAQRSICCMLVLISASGCGQAIDLAGKRLQRDGLKFRQDVLAELKSAKESLRIHDLTELCQRSGFAGLTIAEAETKMRGAGQKGAFVSAKNRLLPPGDDDFDLGGGFGIHSSAISGTTFIIVFRPAARSRDPESQIKEVVTCTILDNAL